MPLLDIHEPNEGLSPSRKRCCLLNMMTMPPAHRNYIFSVSQIPGNWVKARCWAAHTNQDALKAQRLWNVWLLYFLAACPTSYRYQLSWSLQGSTRWGHSALHAYITLGLTDIPCDLQCQQRLTMFPQCSPPGSLIDSAFCHEQLSCNLMAPFSTCYGNS